MAQHAILRFEKHKGNPARPLEAHHERQKEQYATPMGRAMLNICIVFAQLERETIQVMNLIVLLIIQILLLKLTVLEHFFVSNEWKPMIFPTRTVLNRLVQWSFMNGENLAEAIIVNLS